MAIFHSTMKIIGRSQGRSAVGSAAYRAGEIITNEYDGMTHDYTRKGGVMYSEIILPTNAPVEFYNRSKLWNAVELSEKRCDSQTARENEIALPVELNRQEQIALVRDYIHQNFVDKGMCADFTLHDKGDGNPHAHIMLTTRIVGESGFGKKERSWNRKENVEQWRQAWADICNQKLRVGGFEATLDPRSYKEQGIEKVPSIHMGRASQLEKRGIITRKGNENLAIKQKNFEIVEIQRRLNEIERELQELALEPVEQIEREVPAYIKPQELGQMMARMKNRYIELQEFSEKHQSSFEQLNHVITAAQYAQADLDKIKYSLDSFQKNIVKLQIERADLGPFKRREKNTIDQQIQRFKGAIESTESLLQNQYKITPEQILEKKKKLQQQIMETNKRIAQLPDNQKIIEQQREIEWHYKKLSVQVEVHPEKEVIQAAETAYNSTQKHFIMQRINAENKLNDITPREYQQIKAELSGNVRELLEQRERQGGRALPRYARQERDRGREFTFER